MSFWNRTSGLRLKSNRLKMVLKLSMTSAKHLLEYCREPGQQTGVKKMGTIVQLKHVRIAFIDELFEPSQYEGKGDFRHTATFIVELGSANDKAILEAIQKEAVGAWAKKADTMLEDLRGDKKAFSYQKNKKDKTGEVYDGFENMMALSGVRKAKDGAPLFLHNIKDPSTGKAQRLTGKEGVIYAGCYVN